MSTETDFANIAAATAAGYALETWSEVKNTGGSKPVRQNIQTVFHAKLSKMLTVEGGSDELEEYEDTSAVDSATAQANALAQLNAVRRQRYLGAPGDVSGGTVSQFPDGSTPTPDTN